MGKADKLFQKAELEYITPFLKLWLAFNCWYKKDSEADTPPIKTDAQAITKYKVSGKVKLYFLRFFEDTSTDGKNFNEAIRLFVLNAEENYEINDKDNNRVKYTILIENPASRTITTDSLIKVGEGSKKYFIRSDQKEDFFSETLQIIYHVRCCLVHGDFDIDDQYFIQLVESSYKIMYPIMERVLE
ncbi:hypothetical protein AUJ17_04365 [Candidatus Micrarchaeota archaeon CG1_02_47_40]|nr:MAG: hypothetical protein AUJ17_04365 [Candidatus Micrarchaeota archaeon CG1_02_47_40]